MTLEELFGLLPSIGSLFTSGSMIAFVIIFLKVIAPKLAKKEWTDKNIAQLANTYTQVAGKVDEMAKLYVTFKTEFMKVERALDLMATYSNLGDSPKTLIHAILADAGVDAQSLKDFSQETQDLIKETTEKVEQELALKAKSALEELAEEVEATKEG